MPIFRQHSFTVPHISISRTRRKWWVFINHGFLGPTINEYIFHNSVWFGRKHHRLLDYVDFPLKIDWHNHVFLSVGWELCPHYSVWFQPNCLNLDLAGLAIHDHITLKCSTDFSNLMWPEFHLYYFIYFVYPVNWIGYKLVQNSRLYVIILCTYD